MLQPRLNRPPFFAGEGRRSALQRAPTAVKTVPPAVAQTWWPLTCALVSDKVLLAEHLHSGWAVSRHRDVARDPKHHSVTDGPHCRRNRRGRVVRPSSFRLTGRREYGYRAMTRTSLIDSTICGLCSCLHSQEEAAEAAIAFARRKRLSPADASVDTEFVYVGTRSAAPFVLLMTLSPTSWTRTQAPYSVTPALAKNTDKSNHVSARELTKLSVIAARRFTIGAAISTARLRCIASEASYLPTQIRAKPTTGGRARSFHSGHWCPQVACCVRGVGCSLAVSENDGA